MEHEVYVPFALEAVRAALAEPERVARCVPGLQPDAAEPVPGGGADLQGRLRVRIGGSSITYRGSLRLVHRTHEGDEGYTVRGEGSEARGGGSVELILTVEPRPAGDGEGTTLHCAAELRGGGRIAEFEEMQRLAAGRRLLDRFGGELAESMATDPVEPPGAAGAAAASGGIGEPGDNEPAIPGIPAPETPGSADARQDRAAGRAADDGGRQEAGEPRGEPQEPPAEDFPEVGIPSPAAGPEDGAAFREEPDEPLDAEPVDEAIEEVLEEEFADGYGDVLGDDLDELTGPVAAEAAHARRTMIGRSAEEVDHAPPRGRYAPVPAPESASPAAVLRWAVPVAALVLASAVVVGRVLRRRR